MNVTEEMIEAALKAYHGTQNGKQWFIHGNNFRETVTSMVSAALSHRPPVPDETSIIDIEAEFFQRMTEAACSSNWLPPEFIMNDWVSDVCLFLKDGPSAFVPPVPDASDLATERAAREAAEKDCRREAKLATDYAQDCLDEQKRREAAEARVSQLEAALEPFAAVAEHDIGDDETGEEFFQPMARYNRAPRLTVGHFRAVLRAKIGG